ncbi:AraC family transcriptional regulator [Opitutaceae bacterium TAV5]|nr:AraC family transcriptional regulator [Opitutaceae bacterium TAV5]
MKSDLLPHQDYKRDLTAVLARLRAGRLGIHIPPAEDLYRRYPEAHFHPTPEFFVQVGGGTDFKCPGGKFRMGTGQVCVMPRGVAHHETPLDLRSSYGIVVCMQARNGFFLHRARMHPVSGAQEGHGTILLPGAWGRDSFLHLDRIAESKTVPKTYRKAYIHSQLESFLLSVLSSLQLEERKSPVPDTSDVAGSPLVLEAEKIIRKQLSDPELSIARLARSLGCSTDHLSRQFHRERGLRPSVWITCERIRLAKDLLKDARHNVTEVGWACGFNKPSYFIRIFRRHTGQTPREWQLTPGLPESSYIFPLARILEERAKTDVSSPEPLVAPKRRRAGT